MMVWPDSEGLPTNLLPMIKLRQGGAEATDGWNTLMVDALSRLVFCWRQIGYGMRLNSTLYTHVCWSDNWWLFVHKRAHLFQMIQSLTFVLYARRLKWKPDSLSFTASSSGVDRPEIDLDSRRASLKIEAGRGLP